MSKVLVRPEGGPGSRGDFNPVEHRPGRRTHPGREEPLQQRQSRRRRNLQAGRSAARRFRSGARRPQSHRSNQLLRLRRRRLPQRAGDGNCRPHRFARLPGLLERMVRRSLAADFAQRVSRIARRPTTCFSLFDRAIHCGSNYYLFSCQRFCRI